MSETKTYVFGNDGNRGYQNGFDPNFLIGAMMGGGGGFGGFGLGYGYGNGFANGGSLWG